MKIGSGEHAIFVMKVLKVELCTEAFKIKHATNVNIIYMKIWTNENWLCRACNFCDESFERLTYEQKLDIKIINKTKSLKSRERGELKSIDDKS